MKRFFLYSLLITFFPVLIFAQHTVKGSIYDAQSGDPLPGAHISVKNSFINAVSDLNGTFSIANLKPGSYTIVFTYLGFEPVEKTISLPGAPALEIRMQQRAIMEDEVVITATRLGKNAPKTFTNVDREQIKEVNLGKDLPFLLESTPGTVVTSDAGAGIGYTGIRIRGTDITRINVTVNGMQLNDPESQGVFWVNMPDFASSIENIQIQRGVGTSANGAAAFGASINIQTQSLRPEAYAEINSSAGSFNTFKNNISFGTGLFGAGFAIDARLSKITSDGYIDRAFSDLKSFFISGGYYGSNTIVKMKIFSGQEKTYQAWYGIPQDSLATNRTYNPSGEYLDDAGNLAYYPDQTDNYQQDHYQLHISHAFNRNLNLNAGLFYVRGYGYYQSYRPDDKLSDYGLPDFQIGDTTISQTDLIRRKFLDNDFYGINLTGNYSPSNRWRLAFGGGWNHYEGRHFGTLIWSKLPTGLSHDFRFYENTGIKKQYNLFGKVQYRPVKDVNLFGDLQMRGVDYSIKGIHDDQRDISQQRDYLFFNPKFGATVNFNARHQGYFSFAIAHREPTRSDFRDAPENRLPKAERLINYELGYNYAAQNLSLNVNLFLMDYKDQLVLTGEINNVGSPIFTNVSKSYRAGIELIGGVKLLETLRWEGNLSLSRNKIRDFVEFVDNWSPPYEQISGNLGETDLSFSPEVVANSVFTFKPVGELNIKLISRYVGEQFIDNTSNDLRKLEPYFVSDLNISYGFRSEFFDRMDIFLNIANVFSAEYESNAWVYRYIYEGEEFLMAGFFPQAPANFLAGISLKF
jgi:iron complex outermembrane receptor protein